MKQRTDIKLIRERTWYRKILRFSSTQKTQENTGYRNQHAHSRKMSRGNESFQVAEHLAPGESYVMEATRGLLEELKLNVPSVRLSGGSFWKTEHNRRSHYGPLKGHK